MDSVLAGFVDREGIAELGRVRSAAANTTGTYQTAREGVPDLGRLRSAGPTTTGAYRTARAGASKQVEKPVSVIHASDTWQASVPGSNAGEHQLRTPSARRLLSSQKPSETLTMPDLPTHGSVLRVSSRQPSEARTMGAVAVEDCRSGALRNEESHSAVATAMLGGSAMNAARGLQVKTPRRRTEASPRVVTPRNVENLEKQLANQAKSPNHLRKPAPKSNAKTSPASKASPKTSPRDKRRQKNGKTDLKPVDYEEDRAIVQRVSILPPKWASFAARVDVEIEGEHGLSDSELAAVMRLQEASACKRLRFELVRAAFMPGGMRLLLMFPEGRRARARLPSLVQVGDREPVEEELDGFRRLISYFKDRRVAPRAGLLRLRDTAFFGASAALQMDMPSGRCCLPFCNIGQPCAIRPFSRLFEEGAAACINTQVQGPVSPKGEEVSGSVAGRVSTAQRLSAPIGSWAEDPEGQLADGGGAFAALNQVFNLLLPACCFGAVRVEQANLFRIFGTNLEKLVLSSSSPFGPPYYDGIGSNDPTVETTHGSLVSDGARSGDLLRVVQEASGRLQKPSEFFAEIHAKLDEGPMSAGFNCLKVTADSCLDLQNILQEADGRTWLLSANGFNQGQHLFVDPARILSSALFVHTELETARDVKHMRDLVLAIAIIHADGSLRRSLPPIPNEASPPVRSAWCFVQRTLHHFAEYLSLACSNCAAVPREQRGWELRSPRSANEEPSSVSTPSGKHSLSPPSNFSGERSQVAPEHMTKPGLQLVWALFDCAVEMVCSAQTRLDPERKRLALFAAVAFGHLLAAVNGKAAEPKWVAERRRRFGGNQTDSPVIAAHSGTDLYLEHVGVQQAWAPNPVTGEIYYVLEDVVSLKACSNPCADWFGEAQPQEIICGFEEVAAQLEQYHRLLLVGPPGSGKSVLSRGMTAFAAQAGLCTRTPHRLPIQVSCADLANRTGAADALQELMLEHWSFPADLCWETMPEPTPWTARGGHQVVGVSGHLVLIGGMNEKGIALQDVWRSSDDGATWEEMPRPPWPARFGHQVVILDDSLILLGGVGGDERRHRDAWESTDAGQSWMELPCPRWPARYGHQALVMKLSRNGAPLRDHLVVLGGNGVGNKPLRDAWTSDNGGVNWHELEPPPWAARYGHCVLLFQGRLLVVGGVGDGQRRLNDIWLMSGFQWRSLEISEEPRAAASQIEPVTWKCHVDLPWSARDSHQVVAHRGQLLVFGGTSDEGMSGDAWTSLDGRFWKRLPEASWRPVAARSGHCAFTWCGRLTVLGGMADMNPLTKGKRPPDRLRARPLLIVLDDLHLVKDKKQALLSYLERLLQDERHHDVLLTTQASALDTTTMQLFTDWGFKELQVKPFNETDLRRFCNARLGEMEPARLSQIEEALLGPQHRELVSSPLIATMVLRTLLAKPNEPMSRCHVHELALEQALQVRGADLSPNPAGIDIETAARELAYEFQGRGTARTTKAPASPKIGALPTPQAASSGSDAVEALLRLGRSGQLALLFEPSAEAAEGLQFRHPSMQEFLSARHLWSRLIAGDRLPPWLLRETSGNEAAFGCGRFFCALASGKQAIFRDQLRTSELVEGLGCIMRNMARVGDSVAVCSLLDMLPIPELLLLNTDGSRQNHTAMHLAALNGHHEVARALLQRAQNRAALYDAVDSDGYTALHCAAQAGHEQVCRALLDQAPDRWLLLFAPDCSDQRHTALHLAARHGHNAVCRTLLEMCPSCAELNNVPDTSGFTALHLAAQYGHDQVVLVILVFAPYPELLLNTANKYEQRTPLHMAAENGYERVVRALLSDRRLKDDRLERLMAAEDDVGQTALHLAADGGHESAVRALLEATPSNDAREALLSAKERLTGQTPLHFAADAGHSAAVKALLDFATDRGVMVAAVDRCGNYTALHLAAEKGRAAAARALLEGTPNLLTLLSMGERCSGQLALHLAAGAGHGEAVRELLEFAPDRGALLNKVDQEGGFTALHLAVERGSQDAMRALLELAPDRRTLLRATIDRWCGFSALHLASYRGHEVSAQMLLDLAPEGRATALEQRDTHGRTPANLAADRGHQALVSLLTCASNTAL